MKKVLLFALVLSLAMGTAIARQKGGPDKPPRGGNDPIERLTEQLGLNLAQVVKITAIFEDTQILRDEEKEAFQTILCEIRADSHMEILAVLTTDQQVLFDELQQKREETRKAFADSHPEHQFGGRHGMLDCEN